jgi:hypothetical protein
MRLRHRGQCDLPSNNLSAENAKTLTVKSRGGE